MSLLVRSLPFILYGLQRIGLIDRLFSYLRLSDIQNIWLSTLDLDGCNYVIVYLSDGRAYCGLIHQADDDWLILTNYNSVLAKRQTKTQNLKMTSHATRFSVFQCQILSVLKWLTTMALKNQRILSIRLNKQAPGSYAPPGVSLRPLS